MGEWEDISTAPRDGTKIVVFDKKPSYHYGPDIHNAKWDNDLDCFVGCDEEDIDPFDIMPTYWKHIKDKA